MESASQFHWWYIPIILFVLFIMFGKGSKGGMVVKRFIADLKILDLRFKKCRPEAEYIIFKEGSPDKIDIEIENLFLDVGEELELFLNGSSLATITVKRDKEAEFEHWSDEMDFPVIKEGDELVIKYQNAEVIKGTFRVR